MIEFSEAMARLKHALRVSKDVEVGGLLGLSKRAMSDRKKRQSFPERELVELSVRRPDLKIDLAYVLTGVSQQETAQHAAADAIPAKLKNQINRDRERAGRALECREEAQPWGPGAPAGPANSQEAQLLNDLRRCSDSEQQALAHLIATLAAQRT